MSLEMDAIKAAEVALPAEPNSNARSRIPYAAGYIAGHAVSLAATIAFARKVGRRPEIDEPGCCETCRGSGRVAVGPWGSRPPKVTCEDCSGSGWSQ